MMAESAAKLRELQLEADQKLEEMEAKRVKLETEIKRMETQRMINFQLLSIFLYNSLGSLFIH